MEDCANQVSFDAWNNSRCSAEKTTVRLLMEYYQLILYARSQIPEPVQLMHRKLQRKKALASAASNTNSQRTKRAEIQYSNKCAQLLKSLEDLKSCLESFVQKCDFVEALIAVGSTPVSIKEVFTFQSVLENSLSAEKNSYDSEQVNSHARKFCMLMVQSPLSSGDSLSLTNTRLFMRTANQSAAEGCTPWPNLRWSSNKHKVGAKISFHAGSNPAWSLSDSFLDSADRLRILDQNKENVTPSAQSKHIEQCFNLSSSQNSTLPVKEDRSTDTCSEEGNKDNASRKMRFSAAEVLERILVDEDACSVTAGETASNVSASEAKPCGVWLELPVLIKGFKF